MIWVCDLWLLWNTSLFPCTFTGFSTLSTLICLPKTFLSSIPFLWKRKEKHTSKDWWKRITAVNSKWVAFPLCTQVPIQQLFWVSAFPYGKQISISHASLRCWTPNLKPTVARTQIWTYHLSAKHHKFTCCSETDLALFQIHAVVLSNLHHQMPVRDLKTCAFVQSRPPDQEHGAWLERKPTISADEVDKSHKEK